MRCEAGWSRMEQIEKFHARPWGEIMVDRNKLKKSILCLALTLLFCGSAFAQQPTDTQRRTSEQGRNEYGVEQPPDLTQENLGRVAASAIQIRSVLIKDEGLLVELKRWVAKEATDGGQVVEDSSLTDQAIFERLEQDVVFRSVATRLLQRYGYLTPASNPDSDFGKEKELILKERARRLVQIESQEDTESLRPQKNDRDLERTATCDPHGDQDCPQQSQADRRRNTRAPDGIPSPETNPQEAAPEQQPAQSPSRILRADGLPQATDPLDGSSGMGFGMNFELTPASAKRDTNPSASSQSFGQGAGDAIPIARNLPASPVEPNGTTEVFTGKNGRELPSRANYPRGMTKEEDVTPVRMVHRTNPYADIPSLYDMYVQASERQRPNERFGLAAFRNTSNDPRAIPMDLPVGPDYVIGPGDGLAIDLWGGVSQRFVRVVDREGRLSLPEVGPLLVSGRNLADVQQAVQQVLRTQYRDVSVDVSLSKLRTVRVYVVGDVTA